MSAIRSIAGSRAVTAATAGRRPPARRGACPSLAEPMATGDGLLARLSPARPLTPAQLAGVAAAAARFGNGIVEISARGSLQVRGLDATGAAAFAAAVAALGIDVATGVPVATSPLAGLDPTAIADPRPIVARLAAAFAAAEFADRLGPKVSVVVEAGGRIRLDAIAADVRLAATGDGRWRLGLAGDAATATWGGTFDEAAAVDATVAILERVAAAGREARVRSVLATAMAIAGDAAGAGGIAPGIPNDGSRATIPVLTQAVPPTRRRPAVPWLGRFALADGRAAFGFALAFGFTTAADLAAVAAAAEDADEIRFAPAHGLIVIARGGANPGAPAGRTETSDVLVRVAAVAAARGFVVAADDPRLGVSVCAGAPGCASGLIAARGLAPVLAAAAAPLIAAGGHVHVSGCGKGCAHPAAADLVVVGLDGGVGIGHEARAAAAPVETVPVAGIVAAVARHAAHLAGRRR